MRLPKRLVPVPLNPVLSRLRDIAPKTTSHQVLLVRMPSSNFRVHMIQCRGTPQIRSAVGALVVPVFKD